MTKFIARYEGQVVGKRTSLRPYAFAIICQWIEEVAREEAYNYQPTITDRKNFAYYVAIVNGTAPAYTQTPKEIERARTLSAGGWDAYVEHLRDEQIDRFVRSKARGGFKPYVAAWSMSRHNAEKTARGHMSPRCATLAIVPAETV